MDGWMHEWMRRAAPTWFSPRPMARGGPQEKRARRGHCGERKHGGRRRRQSELVSWCSAGPGRENHRNMEDGEEEEKSDCKGVRGARLPCSSGRGAAGAVLWSERGTTTRWRAGCGGVHGQKKVIH